MNHRELYVEATDLINGGLDSSMNHAQTDEASDIEDSLMEILIRVDPLVREVTIARMYRSLLGRLIANESPFLPSMRDGDTP